MHGDSFDPWSMLVRNAIQNALEDLGVQRFNSNEERNHAWNSIAEDEEVIKLFQQLKKVLHCKAKESIKSKLPPASVDVIFPANELTQEEAVASSPNPNPGVSPLSTVISLNKEIGERADATAAVFVSDQFASKDIVSPVNDQIPATVDPAKVNMVPPVSKLTGAFTASNQPEPGPQEAVKFQSSFSGAQTTRPPRQSSNVPSSFILPSGHTTQTKSSQGLLRGGAPALPKLANKPLFRILPQKGKEYSHPLAAAIDIDELRRRCNGANLDNLDIRFPQGLGLEHRAGTRMIAGTPEKSGSFEVEFVVLDRNSARQQSFSEKLEVNPDAKSLWNTIGSESQYRGTPGWKPDQDIKHKQGTQAKILAARVQGKSHAHVGSPCDDDMFIEIQDGWHILVVADGAGSAKLSRLGSQLAVEAAGRFLLEEFLNNPQMASILQALESEEPKEETLKSIAVGSVGKAAYQAYMAITREAKAMDGVSLKDLSTTLLVGLGRPLHSGKWFFCTFWIGDGALGLHRRGEMPILFGTPDSGEYSGQTRFLDAESVGAGLEKRVKHHFVDRFDAFVLMTDGVSDPKFETEARLEDAGAWDEFWTDLDQKVAPYDDIEEAARRLLAYLGFESPGNHDDRTIAILLPTRGH